MEALVIVRQEERESIADVVGLDDGTGKSKSRTAGLSRRRYFFLLSPGHLNDIARPLALNGLQRARSRCVHLHRGLNQRIAKATVSDIHRWIKHLGSWQEGCLHVADIEPLDVLRNVSHPGKTVPEDSGLLPAGNYEWRTPDGKPLESPTPLTWSLTFTEGMTSITTNRPDLVEWLACSPSKLRADPKESPSETCLFTGHESSQCNLELAWIVPPVFSFEFDEDCVNPRKHEGRANYIVTANTIIMRDDLLVDFHDNRFGVDVDNNCRIVTFRQRTSMIPIPSHLSDALLSPETKCFLRDHFRWCLSSHFLGGDLSEDVGLPEIHSAMDALLGSRETSPAPSDDDAWQTPIGQAVKAFKDRQDIFFQTAKLSSMDEHNLSGPVRTKRTKTTAAPTAARPRTQGAAAGPATSSRKPRAAATTAASSSSQPEVIPTSSRRRRRKRNTQQ